MSAFRCPKLSRSPSEHRGDAPITQRINPGWTSAAAARAVS